MSRRRRGTQRGPRREPIDPHAPIKGQLALFGDDPAPAPAEPAEPAALRPEREDVDNH